MNLIKNIKPKELTKGITGHYVHGDNTTFGYIEIKKGTQVPLHAHMHEQITYILEGQLNMNIGGVDHIMTSGMVNVIPSNTPHSGMAISDCKVIDVFAPVREDYKSTETTAWK